LYACVTCGREKADMDILQVALIILVVAAVWAVVELALTIRRARSSVDEISRQAQETIAQIQPIVTKADGLVDELDPTVKQLPALMDKAQTAVDVATVDLASLNTILQDVSEVSGTASSVTSAVNKVADSAAQGVAQVMGKITHGGSSRLTEAPAASKLPSSAAHESDAPADANAVGAKPHAKATKPQTGYVTYDSDDATSGAKADTSHEGE
jgi:uncharacterized protein YoxC